MKKLLVIVLLIASFALGATTAFVSASETQQLKIKVVGAQGSSLINLQSVIEHKNAVHATTQIIPNEYGVPGSPSETLSIADIPAGSTEIVIHINKSIPIP